MKKTVLSLLVAGLLLTCLFPSQGWADCQSLKFDLGTYRFYLKTSGRTQSFVAHQSMSVSSVEVSQQMGGWGGDAHVLIMINGENRASWDINLPDSNTQTYTRSLNAAIDLKAGDEVQYLVYGGTSSSHAGYLTGSGYVKFCGDLVKDPKTYVSNLYLKCLDRSPDSSGVAYYASALENHTMTGAQVARAFLEGDEFNARQTPNFLYVTILYQALCNRNPSGEEVTSWTEKLDSGTTRDSVLSEFLSSREFSDYCWAYGVTPN